MSTHFNTIKEYLLDLDYNITLEDANDEVFIIDDEESGIKNFVIGCADPLVIMEQFIVNLPSQNIAVLKQLLQKNREIIHGAFVLDETGTKVIFRNTLEVENLDKNELEASINSLQLLLSEYLNQLIQFSKM